MSSVRSSESALRSSTKDFRGVTSKQCWARIEREVIPILKRVTQVHAAFYELNPELQPDPIVVSIIQSSGHWQLFSVEDWTAPNPFNYENVKYLHLAFEREIVALRAAHDRSVSHWHPTADESKKRVRKLARRFPRGWLYGRDRK